MTDTTQAGKMTPAKLQEDVCKFIDYLNANGLRTVSMILHVAEIGKRGGMVCVRGSKEGLDDTCLYVMAHGRGLEVRGL